MVSEGFTLTKIARALEVPQHRLIHLCEKGVVIPDVQDADGRGTSRRFSHRNLLEFAIALRIRDLKLPVSAVGVVLRVLRRFEESVVTSIPSFSLPTSLVTKSAPDLRVILGDGQYLFFTLGIAGKRPKVFGGFDISSDGAARLPRLKERTAVAGGEFGAPEGSRHTRFEMSITRIAQDLRSPGQG